jgi:hypothetical protein
VPTGYTEKVIKGELASFADFAWQCSRAMGVAVTMRDEPLSVPTPQSFTVEKYYGEDVEKAKAKEHDVQNWTAQRRQVEFGLHNASVRKSYRESCEEARVARERCEDMLYDVNDWEPPTTEHQGLKDFMIEQLKSTIDFDGKQPDPKWYAVFDTVDDFYQHELETARKAYSSAVHRLREAEARTTERNDWVQYLKVSLDPWMP